VVMQAWVEGVSTRKVDDLVAALGVDAGISKSEVSRICGQLDTEVAAWRSRPLDAQAFPYVFLDATYCHSRVGGGVHGKGGHVTSRAVVIATGVSADGRREVLGCQVGDSEDEVFWTEFLRSLRERGLGGVRLVISDSHAGLRKAITRTMSGAAWQRCRVHFMRNILAKAPKAQTEWVAAAVRTIFAQPDAAAVRCQVETVAASLQSSLPDVARMLRDARADLTAFAGFPVAHWRKIWSTNPLERLNREVKRRTDVVGIFPDDNALLRLASCVLMEAHDEWQVSDRRYLSEQSMTELDTQNNDTPSKEVVDNRAAIPA
jgi:putative transposase